MKKVVNEKGNVTLIALILLVVLTLIGISASRTSTLDMQIARNEIPFKQGFYIAEGGINIEANEIGKGHYPVIDINTAEAVLANTATNPEDHRVLGEPYNPEVRYKGYYPPPAGYSIIHFNRYDYNVETKGGTNEVRVASRFYKIGPKGE